MTGDGTGAQEIRIVDGPLPPSPGLVRIGTRGSTLAVTQSGQVARAIAESSGLETVLVVVRTAGDGTTAPLAQLGGTGVFVNALRDALLEDRCDLAIHSLKDLPTGACAGIGIAAIPERADARDALCARDGLGLAALPEGARVGTGSPRRAAQLRALRPDLSLEDLRGNVDTRLGRVGVDLDAVVLAAAGLERIGRSAAITEYFPLDRVPTAPGQGALAVEARQHDGSGAWGVEPGLGTALRAIDHAESRLGALAERSLLQRLEAGCSAPVGAWGRIAGDSLVLTSTVYRADGGRRVTLTREQPLGARTGDGADARRGDDAEENAVRAVALGARLADDLLAAGAAELADLGGGR